MTGAKAVANARSRAVGSTSSADGFRRVDDSTLRTSAADVGARCDSVGPVCRRGEETGSLDCLAGGDRITDTRQFVHEELFEPGRQRLTLVAVVDRALIAMKHVAHHAPCCLRVARGLIETLLDVVRPGSCDGGAGCRARCLEGPLVCSGLIRLHRQLRG